MAKTLEEKMSELPEERQEKIKERAKMLIELVETRENEDGSAVYSFDLSEDVNRMCGELGLKLLLWCGVCQIGPEHAFETIFKVHAPKEEQDVHSGD